MNTSDRLRRLARCGLVLFVVAVTVSALASSAPAGLNAWTSTGPEGGTISGGLAVDPQTAGVVYAVALQGSTRSVLFKSSTGGSIWVPINAGLPVQSLLFAVAVDPRTPANLYTATGAGVFKSSNGGATWSSSNLGLGNNTAYSLAIDPQTPAIVYAGTPGGVFKSSNGGGSWSNTGLTLSTVSPLAIDPQTPATVYVGTFGGQLYKSINGGASWSLSNAGLPKNDIIRALVIDPQTPTILYAGTSNHGVFKSTDGGANWSQTALSGFVGGLAIDPKTPTILYAATPGGVFKSSNGGASWSATALVGQFVYAIVIEPRNPGVLYAGTQNGGVFRSADGGGSWGASNTALAAQTIEALAVDPRSPTTVYAVSGGGVGSYGGGALFKTANGGGSWSAIESGAGRFLCTIAVDPQTPATLYAGTNGGVLKSTNAGGSWTFFSVSDFLVCALAIDPLTPSTVYAGTLSLNGGVFKSVDGGVHWGPSDAGLMGFVQSLVIDPRTPATLYAASGPGLFKSANGGGGWVEIGPQAPGGGFLAGATSLAIDPQNSQALYVGIAQDPFGGVFKSADGGASWSPVRSGLTNLFVTALAIDPHAPTTVYAGTLGGVFRSTNAGGTWNPVNSGLSNLHVLSLAMNPAGTCVHAGTEGAGVFDFATAQTSAECASPPSLVSALLPSSRSVQVGAPATAFATIINAGPAAAASSSRAGSAGVDGVSCGITQITGLPTPFGFQATDPASNQVIGTPNAPVDIPPGAAQSFVISLTPASAFSDTTVQFGFNCTNAALAPTTVGVNTLLVTASDTPVPDIIALAATLANDGIVNIPGPAGTGAFAVATTNVGAAGTITVSADTGSAALPVSLALCQTNPATAACLAPPASSVTTPVNAHSTPTFSIFVTGGGVVPFDPGNNRVFVRFTDAGGVTRGATSVAVRTQ